MPYFREYCRHDIHVALAPLSSQMFRLHLEQLQRVQLQEMVFSLSNSQEQVHTCRRICRTRSVRRNMGALLNTTSIIVRACFHLVNLFSKRNRLIAVYRLRHEAERCTATNTPSISRSLFKTQHTRRRLGRFTPLEYVIIGCSSCFLLHSLSDRFRRWPISTCTWERVLLTVIKQTHNHSSHEISALQGN